MYIFQKKNSAKLMIFSLGNTQDKLHTRLVVILWKSQFGPRKMRVKAHIFMLNLPFILLHILCMLFMLWAFAPFGCCQKLKWAKNQNKNLVKMSYLVSILEKKHLRISLKKIYTIFFQHFFLHFRLRVPLVVKRRG